MPQVSMTSPLVSRLYQLSAAGGHALADDRCGRSFTELVDRAVTIAAHLHARSGLERGGRVAILASPGVTWVEVFLAVVLAGGVAVPLSPLYPATELAWFTADAGADLV